MQSTNIRQIKAALWRQAFLGGTQVSCPIGRGHGNQEAQRTAASARSWVGALVSGGECAD